MRMALVKLPVCKRMCYLLLQWKIHHFPRVLTKLCFCVLWPLETASFHVHTLSPPLLQSESARKWQKARHAVGPIAQPSRFDDTKSQLSHINNKEANGENLKNHPTWRKQLDARSSNNNSWIFFSNAVLATLGGHLHVFHPVSLPILDPPHYSWSMAWTG